MIFKAELLVDRACCHNMVSRQIIAMPDLCCIVTQRSLESVGGVFDPVVSSATCYICINLPEYLLTNCPAAAGV